MLESLFLDKDDLVQKTNLKRIKTGTDKIQQTVKQLLDIHRKEVNIKEKVNVNKVILSTLNLLTNQLEINSIKIEKNLCNHILRVNAIDQELFQVFMNMILNAQDAMKNGGILKISTKVDDQNIYIEFQDKYLCSDKIIYYNQNFSDNVLIQNLLNYFKTFIVNHNFYSIKINDWRSLKSN